MCGRREVLGFIAFPA